MSKPRKMNLGAESLSRAKERLGLTNNDIARAVGGPLTDSVVGKYLRGRQVPGDERRKRFLDLYGIPIDAWSFAAPSIKRKKSEAA